MKQIKLTIATDDSGPLPRGYILMEGENILPTVFRIGRNGGWDIQQVDGSENIKAAISRIHELNRPTESAVGPDRLSPAERRDIEVAQAIARRVTSYHASLRDAHIEDPLLSDLVRNFAANCLRY